MRTMQQYWTDKVEEIANNLKWQVYEQKEYNNCGWWFFKKNNKPTKKVYFDFQNSHFTLQDGPGMMYDGVMCEYPSGHDEIQAISYIMKKLNE